MAQNGGDASKASPSGRARHQISRSLSEISSPIRLSRQQSHRTGKDQNSERETNASIPQQTVPATHNHLVLEKPVSEGVAPSLTLNSNQHESILYTSINENMPIIKLSKENGQPKEPAKEPVQVVKEPARVRDKDRIHTLQNAAARERALRQSVSELETFANSSAKQLEDAYYSVLEKLNQLQSTISALKELSDHTRQLNSNFKTETDEMVGDISTQLDALGQFEDQQKRIAALQGRIYKGKEMIRSLSQRVDAVSQRIDRWQRADKAWQERTRKRLTIGWAITSVVTFVLIALFVTGQYGPESTGVENALSTHLVGDGSDAIAPASSGGSGLDGSEDGASVEMDATLWNPPEAQPLSSSQINSTAVYETPLLMDDMLRAFDEL